MKERNEEGNKEKRKKIEERKHDRTLIRRTNDVEHYIIAVSHPSNLSRSMCFTLL
jgi:hypothetical protein